jgi:hypothetical protein
LFPKYVLEDFSVGSGSIIGKDNIEEFDAWWMTSPLGTPRGRYDEYSSSFSLSKKPRFNDDQKKSRQMTAEGDAC